MLTGTDPFDNAAPDLSNPDCAEGQITSFSGNLSLSDSMWFFSLASQDRVEKPNPEQWSSLLFT